MNISKRLEKVQSLKIVSNLITYTKRRLFSNGFVHESRNVFHGREGDLVVRLGYLIFTLNKNKRGMRKLENLKCD